MAVKRHNVVFDLDAKDNATRALAQVERGLSGVNGAAAALSRTLGGAVLATAAISFGRDLVKRSMEAEQASNRLNAVLRATGQAAGLTREKLDGVAEALARSTQFDDDDIRNGQAQLLKFGNINEQTFGRALKLSADLAAFMGTDLTTAVQSVGKAVSSPKEGLMALERQIGKLDPVVKRQIEQHIEQNRVFEAQALLLDALRGKIGGTAELMNQGLTKAVSDLGKAWDDLVKAMGGTEAVRSPTVGTLSFLSGELKRLKDIIEKGTWTEKLLAIIAWQSPVGRAVGWKPELSAPGRREASGRIGQHIPGLSDIEDFESSLARADAAPRMTAEEVERAQEKAKREAEQRDREAQREAVFRSEKAVELEEMAAQDRLEASEAMKDVAIRNEREIMDGRRRSTEALVESAEIEQERLEGLIFTWDRYGNRIEVTREAFDEMATQEKRNAELARDLGFTFSSAFEDAIVKGGDLRDVLKGLEQDIARIIIRRSVTEPLAGALSAGIAGLFSGSPYTSSNPVDVAPRAHGGDVSTGRPYFVGEEGPELFVPGQSGSIVPNDGLGGMTVTVNQNIHVDSRSDQGSIIAAMHAAKEQAKAEIARLIRNGNAQFRTDV